MIDSRPAVKSLSDLLSFYSTADRSNRSKLQIRFNWTEMNLTKSKFFFLNIASLANHKSLASKNWGQRDNAHMTGQSTCEKKNHACNFHILAFRLFNVRAPFLSEIFKSSKSNWHAFFYRTTAISSIGSCKSDLIAKIHGIRSDKWATSKRFIM